MSKKSNVLLEPKSLNEKTLELNITNELLNLFNGFHWRSSPDMLRRLFRPMTFPFRLPWIHGAFASGLAAREEGTGGGGWDVKITVPNGFGDGARALFVQFKKGEHQSPNGDPRSKFQNKIHAQFKLDNEGKTQHKALQGLAAHLKSNHLPNDSVVYGFPRVTTKDQFEKLRGKLLLYTSFLSIDELDQEAKSNGVSIVDGNDHFFKACYRDHQLREIWSSPFALSNTSQTKLFLVELFRYKLSKLWNAIYDARGRSDYFPDIVRFNLSFILSAYLGHDQYYSLGNARASFESQFAGNFLRENARFWDDIETSAFGDGWNIDEQRSIKSDIYEQVMKIFETDALYIDDEQVGTSFSIPIEESLDIRLQAQDSTAYFDYQII